MKIHAKNDSPTASSNDTALAIGKMQAIVHNTSEHVQELNQMCQIKDPKEFDKSLNSKFETHKLK